MTDAPISAETIARVAARIVVRDKVSAEEAQKRAEAWALKKGAAKKMAAATPPVERVACPPKATHGPRCRCEACNDSFSRHKAGRARKAFHSGSGFW